MARAIDSEAAYQFLTDQLVKESGAFSKGVNKGLNIARSAMRNPDAIPTLTPPNDPMTLEFDVVDTTTGKYPDWERITIEEPWANRLVDCDMDGIAIREDGTLLLLDECGKFRYCPIGRFEIRRPPEGENA